MSRRLRWIQPHSLTEITDRCFQGRFLLRPSPQLNRLIIGIFARAKELYPIKLHSLSVMSNHWHSQISAENGEQLSDFMEFTKTNVSKEVGRLHGWKGTMWEGRYDNAPTTGQPAIQIQRLEYILSQGCKEGLVASPYDWPGINSAKALVEGKPLQGVWYDRSKEYAARNSGIDYKPCDFATEYELHFDPLPCWAHLDPRSTNAASPESCRESKPKRESAINETAPNRSAVERSVAAAHTSAPTSSSGPAHPWYTPLPKRPATPTSAPTSGLWWSSVRPQSG